MLRYLTAGESHGRGLSVIVEGLPAGVPLTDGDINTWLTRRQGGYGRGGRMAIERDRAEILGGVRGGLTLGSPIAIFIANRDWENWQEIMAPGPGSQGRPGSNPTAAGTCRPGGRIEIPPGGPAQYPGAGQRPGNGGQGGRRGGGGSATQRISH